MSDIRIQCVVVLYKCAPKDAAALQSLACAFEQEKGVAQSTALLLYDNSPLAQQIEACIWNCGTLEYQHHPENGGLAAAYNAGLTLAQQRGTEWLFLLDQDTSINAEMLSALDAAIARPVSDQVCAIVPKLVQSGKVLSPQLVSGIRNRMAPITLTGLQTQEMTAFNSAACLRVASLTAIGGFPVSFWLDYLDHVIHHRLYAAGNRIFVLDSVVEHRLSTENMEKEMSVDRYMSMLAAEWRFIRETNWGGGPGWHRLRLLKRAARHAVRLQNKAYAAKTLLALGA